MAETYTFALVCSNCRHRWHVEIPRGKILKNDAFRHCYWEQGEFLECPHCGVTEYGPQSDISANERLGFMPSQADELKALRKGLRRAKNRIREYQDCKGLHPELRAGCMTALTILAEETDCLMEEADK